MTSISRNFVLFYLFTGLICSFHSAVTAETGTNQFNDVRFHLANYIQGSIDANDFL